MRDELADPDFDPASNAWLVGDAAGTTVAYGWAHRRGSGAIVDIEAIGDDPVADWLWAQVIERARQLGAAAGHDEIDVDIGLYQNDEAQRARADARGFAPATTFQRMRIDFDEPPAAPTVPDGVMVRTGPGDETFRRQANGVSREAFRQHFGFVEVSFEEWHRRIDSASTTDWAQLRVAYIDGEPVAMVRGTNEFIEDEDCGYVATVAVLPGFRGRGLATLLLRQAFVDDFQRGRRGTVLHVDSNNVTPAVDLYLRVGMRSVLAVDVWRARVPTR